MTESRERFAGASTRPLDPRRTITIVSGLPRSGTSMMMQMLEAAGLPLATDGLRPADPHNPGGYYELDAVRRLPSDATFLAQTVGRVVKVVAPLLPALPAQYDYRIVFMRRDLDELLASQRAMLIGSDGGRAGRGSREADAGQDAALGAAFSATLRQVEGWLSRQARLHVCDVEHRQLLASPASVSAAVVAFLEDTGALGERRDAGDLAARMAAVVDPALHRQRILPRD